MGLGYQVRCLTPQSLLSAWRRKLDHSTFEIQNVQTSGIAIIDCRDVSVIFGKGGTLQNSPKCQTLKAISRRFCPQELDCLFSLQISLSEASQRFADILASTVNRILPASDIHLSSKRASIYQLAQSACSKILYQLTWILNTILRGEDAIYRNGKEFSASSGLPLLHQAREATMVPTLRKWLLLPQQRFFNLRRQEKKKTKLLFTKSFSPCRQKTCDPM